MFPLRQPTLLLIGPTGAGKTPLGELLQSRGWRGTRCLHFDFGHHLRQAAAGADYGLSPDHVQTIRTLLTENALLPDDKFAIASRILSSCCDKASLAPDDWLILNGLPRHAQQARALEATVRVPTVIVLDCDAQTVRQRIAHNTGGDRTARADDSPSEIERKLELFRQRTLPLIEYYRQGGAAIVHLCVTASATAADLLRDLSVRL